MNFVATYLRQFGIPHTSGQDDWFKEKMVTLLKTLLGNFGNFNFLREREHEVWITPHCTKSKLKMDVVGLDTLLLCILCGIILILFTSFLVRRYSDRTHSRWFVDGLVWIGWFMSFAIVVFIPLDVASVILMTIMTHHLRAVTNTNAIVHFTQMRLWVTSLLQIAWMNLRDRPSSSWKHKLCLTFGRPYIGQLSFCAGMILITSPDQGSVRSQS